MSAYSPLLDWRIPMTVAVLKKPSELSAVDSMTLSQIQQLELFLAFDC